MQLSIYCSIASAIVDTKVSWWEQVDSNYQQNCLSGRPFFPRCKASLVGTSGLEPPTSRLSGVCSNQLSYVPAINVIFAHRVMFYQSIFCSNEQPTKN